MKKEKKRAPERAQPEKTQPEKTQPEKSAARVYCGPSVRNVARQYTVYQGDVPKALADFIAQHPEVRGLLVPMDRFAATRAALETKGTAEAVLFDKIKKKL